MIGDLNLEDPGAGTLHEQCPHSFDAHVVLATTGDPMRGGVIICPVKECLCYSTWSPKIGDDESARDNIREPDEEELKELRARFQTVDG